MRTRFQGISLVSMSVLSVAMLAACPASDDGGGTLGTGGADDDPSTMTAPATGSADDGNTGMLDDGGSGTAGGMTMTDTGGSDGPMGCPQDPQANGASCTDACECTSGICYFVPAIGGSCGECQSDADCPDGGCTIPNPLADPPQGSVCNMGEAGAGCETSEVCQEGLQCGVLLDVPGILTLSTCGECITDADCGEQLCSPTIDVASFSGQKLCVDPMSVPNGQACDLMGTGAMACMSGICATVDIMGIAQVGVCGDCDVDADCDMAAGEMCLDANIDTKTGEVTPPTCGVP